MTKEKSRLDTTTRKMAFYRFSILIIGILLTTKVANCQKGNGDPLSFTSGAAEQSSLGTIGNVEGFPTRAIDGNTRTCSRTLEEDNPWWRGELEQEYEVKKVTITNERLAEQALQLEGAVISVGSCINDTAIATSTTTCGTVSRGQAMNEQTIQINCQSNVFGKYVYITIPGERKILGLCEVEVQGFEIAVGTRPTISFSSTTYTISESMGTVELTVTRSRDIASCSSFGISTLDGTATSPVDFIGADGEQMFQFPPGELSIQVSVSLVDDMDMESMESFTVHLQNLMGLELGDISTAEVHVVDDDSPTTLEPTTIPTTTPTVPTTTPTVPTTTPTVSPTTPTVPPTTPTVPTTTPTVPTTTPTVPTTTPTVPPTTPTVPTTTPTVPTTTPTVPTTTPTVPTTAPTVPTTTPTVPTTTPTVPTTAPTVPTTTPTIPTTTPTVPTTTPTVPTTRPILPTTTQTVQATTPTIPTTTPTVPTTTPTVPTTTPTVPTTTPTIPTTTPTVPTTTPTIPTTTPTVPTTTPTVPTTTPTVPTTTPTIPTTISTVPTTTPTVSFTTPTVPTTTPTVPITTPTVPTTTPTVPTTTPAVLTTLTVPTTTPTISTTTPTVPTTTPTVPTTIPAIPTITPTVPTTTPTLSTTTPTIPITTPALPTTTPTIPTTTPTVPTTTPTVPTTTPTIQTTTPTIPTTTPTVLTTTQTIQTTTLTIPTTTPIVLTTTPTIPTTTPIVSTTTPTVSRTSTVSTMKSHVTTKSPNTAVTMKTDFDYTGDPEYIYTSDYETTSELVTETMNSESTATQIVDSCIMETTNINELVLSWPQTLASESYVGSYEKCAEYSFKAGEPKGFRLCSVVGNVAQWNPPITNECFEGMEMNGQIERLAMTTVTSENVEVISSDLVDLTEDSDDLDKEGLASAAEVLDTITMMDNYTSSMVTANVFQILDNLLEVDQEEFRRAQASNATSSLLLMALETEITGLRNNGSNYTYEGDNIEIMILQLPRHAFEDGFKFTSVDDTDDGDSDYERHMESTRGGREASQQAAIYLPEAILNFLEDEMISVSFVSYENDKLFQSKTPLVVGGQIISASVSNAHVVGLPNEDPVVPSFSTQKIGDRDRQRFNDYTLEASPHCVFWNLSASYGLGDWSTEGCSLASYNGEEAVCHCNHLTNFAVLLDVRGGEVHNLTLDLLSKIGCAVSIAALIITILTYLNIRNLRTKQPQRILLHLSFSLLGLYSVFLVGIEQTHSYYGCIVVAGLIHYFTLTSACWMSVEAFNMYFVFVRVLNARVSHFLTKAAAFAWGLPLVIVALVAGFDHTQYYNDHHCFLRPGVVFSFAVVLIVVLILMFNFFIFFIVMHRLTCGRKSKGSNKKMAKEGWKRLQNVITISVLLGLTWTFGFLTAIESATFQLQLIFCIFNSLQGLFIFLLFCVRQKEVRLAWKAWFTGSTIRRMSMSSYLSSRKRSSALSLTKNALYRTRDSKGNLNASLGNLSHISDNSTLQTAPVITANDITDSNSGEYNRFSTLSTADSGLSTFSSPPDSVVERVREEDEQQETMSNDSGVPNLGLNADEDISDQNADNNVIVYV